MKMTYYNVIDKEELKHGMMDIFFSNIDIYNPPWSVINYIYKGCYHKLIGSIQVEMKF